MKHIKLYSKQHLLEALIGAYFTATLTVLFQAIFAGEFWGIWVFVTILVSSGYLSLMGVYATLKKEHDHTLILLGAHTVIFFLAGLIMQLGLIQFATLTLFTLIYDLFIYQFLRVMNREIQNRIFFEPRRIVFPFIQRFVLGFILIASLFVYFQISENSSGEERQAIPSSLVSSQSELLTPILQQFEPDYREGMSVEELLTVRVNQSIDEQQDLSLPPGTQLVDVPSSVRNQLIDREVQKIEEQYSIEINKEDDVLNVFVSGLNQMIENRLGGYVSPVLLAIVAALFVFVGFLSLMPIYGIVIKIGIATTSWIFVKAQFVELEEEVVTKHIMKI